MKIEISTILYNIAMILLVISASFVVTKAISAKFIHKEEEGDEEEKEKEKEA
jgi:hypothetical protein